MKFNISPVRAAALVALIASVEAAHHGHTRHHGHVREARTFPENNTLEKKSGQCQFPSDAGLVAVTPNEQNAGWAMSPDQPCKPGNYCPYACPPGQVSMQWDPEATSYSYPMSMNGGLYCDESGNIKKPFPNKPYCQDGTGAVQALNKAGKPVAFCQTVLPGNEAMLIPTLVEELSTLAVPGMSYWCETAAQYYVNAPGVAVEEACVWGTSANPIGNWSPFTMGANTVSNGDTYLKIGWNPIYLEPATPFRDVKPEFGLEILCDGDGCNGLPCRIDPSTMGVNEMDAPDVFTGAGGATGCVVTVPSGAKANVVVFDVSGGSSKDSKSSSSSSSSKSSTTSTVASTTTSSTEAPSSTSTSSSSTTSASSSSSKSDSSTSSGTSSSDAESSNTRLPKSSPTNSYTYRPHVFTGSAEISSASSSSSSSASSTTGSPAGAASAAASTTASHNGAASATFSVMSVALGAMAALVLNF